MIFPYRSPEEALASVTGRRPIMFTGGTVPAYGTVLAKRRRAARRGAQRRR